MTHRKSLSRGKTNGKGTSIIPHFDGPSNHVPIRGRGEESRLAMVVRNRRFEKIAGSYLKRTRINTRNPTQGCVKRGGGGRHRVCFLDSCLIIREGGWIIKNTNRPFQYRPLDVKGINLGEAPSLEQPTTKSSYRNVQRADVKGRESRLWRQQRC